MVNADPRENDLACLRGRVSDAVKIEDRSSEWGKLDVQGPASFEVLDGLIDGDISALGYFHAMRSACRGAECIVSRSGYTGELGYEIFLPADSAVELFAALTDHPLVSPAGLGARDMLRLEMCYPLYGDDISTETTPLEADLGRFVDMGRNYVGSDALVKAASAGVARKLVAFRCESRRRGNTGVDILSDGKVVGVVTSAGYSPSLGVSIGMGYMEASLAEPGARISLRCPRGRLDAVVTDKPLYTQGTCRTRNLAWESDR